MRQGSRNTLLVATLATALGLAGCTGPVTSEVAIESWSASSPEATTLTVTVLLGKGDTIESVDVVSESDEDVVLSAQAVGSDEVDVDLGVVEVVEVDLAGPIGDRAVVTEDGSAIPQS